MPKYRPFAERFWEKVIKTPGCWDWNGYKNKHGYGVIGFEGKRSILAHRASMLLAGHDIEGKEVCHFCDNPACSNPAHLFVATQRENLDDMLAKGRKFSKLTEGDVRLIRASSDRVKKLAERFGVHRSSIYNAREGRTWNRVGGAP